MDKFEGIASQMMQISEEERIKMNEEKKPMCTCPTCPSYNVCSTEGNELLFCALGGSKNCITVEKECICPDCPITDQMGLKFNYFCTRDSEKNQRGM